MQLCNQLKEAANMSVIAVLFLFSFLLVFQCPQGGADDSFCFKPEEDQSAFQSKTIRMNVQYQHFVCL